MFVIRRKGRAVTMQDFKDAYNKMIIKETREEVAGCLCKKNIPNHFHFIIADFLILIFRINGF